MSGGRDRGSALFGRRQLLVGGGTFLAGLAGLVACDQTHQAATTVGSLPGSTVSQTAPTTAPPPTIPPSTTVAAPTTAPVDVTEPTSTAAVGSAAPATVDGPAAYVNHGPSNVDKVALTFHLGGDPTLVAELLDLLKANGITSTLFAIGDWLTANPQLGHRALADGHELGNHTKSHRSMLTLTRAAVRAEIVGGGQALIPFIGSIGKWFRPSGTDVPSAVILEEAGLAGYAVSVGYDIDSRDYTEPGAEAVIARVKKQLHAGAIVSLHFGHRDTIDALPHIIELLTTAGLAPVTVTGLLG